MAVGSFPSIQKILANRIEFAIQNMRENIVEDGAFATRNLLASIRPVFNVFGQRIEALIIMADYWEAVDKGQKPGHRPPLDKIITWTIDKGLDISTSVRQKKVIKSYKGGLKRKVKTLLKTINREQVAKAIVEKIYKYGTKPTYFASDVINQEWMQRVGKQLELSGAKDIIFKLNVPKETRI